MAVSTVMATHLRRVQKKPWKVNHKKWWQSRKLCYFSVWMHACLPWEKLPLQWHHLGIKLNSSWNIPKDEVIIRAVSFRRPTMDSSDCVCYFSTVKTNTWPCWTILNNPRQIWIDLPTEDVSLMTKGKQDRNPIVLTIQHSSWEHSWFVQDYKWRTGSSTVKPSFFALKTIIFKV